MSQAYLKVNPATVVSLASTSALPVLGGVLADVSNLGDAGAGVATLGDLATWITTTGSANPTFTGKIASTTALATPSTLAATQFTGFASTVSGATLMGYGTTHDVTLKNRAGTTVLGVTANTTGVTMAGALAITGALSGVTTLAASSSITSTGAAGGVGYATGAGSAATQLTNKSTTVAFNALCGAITMNNAQLDAGVIVSFTFTNTSIAATDVLVLNHISGGTIGSYSLNAQAAAGSATINVRNNTAGNLSEAIVIQFAVLKGVNA